MEMEAGRKTTITRVCIGLIPVAIVVYNCMATRTGTKQENELIGLEIAIKNNPPVVNVSGVVSYVGGYLIRLTFFNPHDIDFRVTGVTFHQQSKKSLEEITCEGISPNAHNYQPTLTLKGIGPDFTTLSNLDTNLAIPRSGISEVFTLDLLPGKTEHDDKVDYFAGVLVFQTGILDIKKPICIDARSELSDWSPTMSKSAADETAREFSSFLESSNFYQAWMMIGQQTKDHSYNNEFESYHAIWPTFTAKELRPSNQVQFRYFFNASLANSSLLTYRFDVVLEDGKYAIGNDSLFLPGSAPIPVNKN